MSPDVQWAVLWPVLAPALGAVLVLVLDAVHPRAGSLHLWVSGAALVVGAAATVPGLGQPAGAVRGSFCLPDGHCLYAAGSVASGLQLLALLAALVVVVLAWPDWSRPEAPAADPALAGAGGQRQVVETHGRVGVLAALVLAATAGVAAVPAAGDLGTLLVALELATLPTIGLVALERRGGRADAAVAGSVALLTTSLVSFALLALGAALWVAATGTGLLDGAGADLAGTQEPAPGRAALLLLAAVFALSGLGFKLSAVPFHAWTPVTYARAPLPVTVYLAGASKVAALGGILVVVRALAGSSASTLVAVGVIAVASMTLGNVMALRESHLVRLLAWSAVAQAGWVLLPLASASARSVRAAAGYLTVYLVATLLAFAVVLVIATAGRRLSPTLEDHRGLARRHPLLAAALGLALLTLAGLPPAVVGLVAKVVALRPVAGEGTWWLAVAAAVNVALGIAVYLRWLAALIERTPVDEHGRPAPGSAADGDPVRAAYPGRLGHHVVIGVLAAALVLGSLAPVGIF